MLETPLAQGRKTSLITRDVRSRLYAYNAGYTTMTKFHLMLNTLRKSLGPLKTRPKPRCIAEIEGFGYSANAGAGMITEFPPGFFVVGAPRCGTTAVSKALAENPRISFSKPKEPHYFLEPRPGMSPIDLRRQYLSRYHHELTAEHQAIGDGSVSYLYEPDAIRRVLDFDPRAKFIVLVRNPVEMMRSYHSRMLYQLDEDEEDFARAWELQTSRAAGLGIPKRCRDARLLQYGHLGKLGMHLERLFEVAGRKRCHVIVFDDFVKDPRAVYLRALEFIGVDDDGQVRFKRKRGTSGFKSRWLQQFVMNPPAWTYRLLAISDARMLKRLKGLRKRIKTLNSRDSEQRQVMTDEMRAKLRDYFAEDVAKLSGLLSRDFSHWR
jgi:Sulfotransferase domain